MPLSKISFNFSVCSLISEKKQVLQSSASPLSITLMSVIKHLGNNLKHIAFDFQCTTKLLDVDFLL